MAKDTNTYIGRMEHFITQDMKRLSPSEVKLFLLLFHLNNKSMWAEWFEVGNRILSLFVGLDERNLLRTKKGLKEKGLIDFTPGKRGQPTKYRLFMPGEIDSMSKYTGKNDIETDILTDIETDIETTPQTRMNTGVEKPLRHKTKEIRRRERKKGKPFSPPTLEEVKAYVKEKGLPIDPQYFLDYFTAGDWHDSKGQPVKNWKQKALTWARHNKHEAPPPEAVTLSQEEQKARQEARAKAQAERVRKELQQWATD